MRTGPLGEAIYACILVLCVGGGARGQAAALRVRTDSDRRFAQELTRLHGVIMSKEENADPLGPVEEEFVTDPGIYRRSSGCCSALARCWLVLDLCSTTTTSSCGFSVDSR